MSSQNHEESRPVLNIRRNSKFDPVTKEEKPVKLPLSQKLVVGGFAGIIGAFSTFPIDIVKTRLQSQIPNAKGVLPYSGPIDCFKKIVARDGIKGLFRGLPPTLVGIVPEKAIKLAVNDYLREYLEEEDGSISLPKQILAGGGAGMLQVIATNPMEIVKIRMQTQHAIPAAERKTAMEIVRHLGITGLYRGVFSTLSRDVPYAVVFFPMYATLKQAASKSDGSNSVSSIVGCGAASGATAAAVVTPADVIKTRRQMKGARFDGLMDCYRHIIKTDGHQALFRGVGPRMMVQAPLFGITLLAFELQKQYMGGY